MLANLDSKSKKVLAMREIKKSSEKKTTLKYNSDGSVREARFASCIPEDLFLCFALSSPGVQPRNLYEEMENFRVCSLRNSLVLVFQIFLKISREILVLLFLRRQLLAFVTSFLVLFS